MRFLSVNGRSHGVAIAGQHDWPVVVFLNALGTDYRIWDEVAAQLSGVRTLRYDLPGHGLSDADPDMSIVTLAADLGALLDALNISSAMLCGVSVGGLIAQQLAFTSPERVSGLMLCDTAYRIGTRTTWTQRIELIESWGLPAAATGIVERWFTTAFRARCPATVAGYQRLGARTGAASYVALAQVLRDTDLEVQTPHLRCRTLVLCGSDDVATPPETARVLADAIPGARFALISEAGHLPLIEQPAVVASHIASFVRPQPHVQ
jgi:3-oxoadipate enol-lactonase